MIDKTTLIGNGTGSNGTARHLVLGSDRLHFGRDENIWSADHPIDVAAALETDPLLHFRGTSPRMHTALELVEQFGPCPFAMVITGESGTGKSLLAHCVHKLSDLRNGPFVVMSAPNITSDLADSEIFGHVKGSFTGAVADRVGKIEKANHGTLFIDEFASLPLQIQAKLLVFLQDGTYSRVGESVERKSDVRVIVASNCDLHSMMDSGTLRQDLYYRLNEITIPLPPLREQKEDIRKLAMYFIAEASFDLKMGVSGISADAVERLNQFNWPGNNRQLQHACQAAIVRAHHRAKHATLQSEISPKGEVVLHATDFILDDGWNRSHSELVYELPPYDFRGLKTSQGIGTSVKFNGNGNGGNGHNGNGHSGNGHNGNGHGSSNGNGFGHQHTNALAMNAWHDMVRKAISHHDSLDTRADCKSPVTERADNLNRTVLALVRLSLLEPTSKTQLAREIGCLERFVGDLVVQVESTLRKNANIPPDSEIDLLQLLRSTAPDSYHYLPDNFIDRSYSQDYPRIDGRLGKRGGAR